MGHIAHIFGLIEILKARPRMRGVRREIVIAPIGDAFQLAPAPGVEKLHIGRLAGIVAELVWLVIAQAQHLGWDA